MASIARTIESAVPHSAAATFFPSRAQTLDLCLPHSVRGDDNLLIARRAILYIYIYIYLCAGPGPPRFPACAERPPLRERTFYVYVYLIGLSIPIGRGKIPWRFRRRSRRSSISLCIVVGAVRARVRVCTYLFAGWCALCVWGEKVKMNAECVG